MNVYRVEILIVDHDHCGPTEIKSVIENSRYPNRCIMPHVMNIEEREIGDWEDNNPLNFTDTSDAEYRRLFGLPLTNPVEQR